MEAVVVEVSRSMEATMSRRLAMCGQRGVESVHEGVPWNTACHIMPHSQRQR